MNYLLLWLTHVELTSPVLTVQWKLGVTGESTTAAAAMSLKLEAEGSKANIQASANFSSEFGQTMSSLI